MAKSKATHTWVIIRARPLSKTSSIPLDMMRYDNCCPATERDSNRLERCERGDHDGEWVYFQRFVPYMGSSVPTVERWRSFGWECDSTTYTSVQSAIVHDEIVLGFSPATGKRL